MGLGSFIKKAAAVAAAPVASTTLFGIGGSKDSNQAALLSGIPFIGKGFAQQEGQRFSAQQAQQQMDFQKSMSDTAHQREVADLRAAGLNPILSAHGGASSPPGAAGSTTPMADDTSSKMIHSMMNKERQKAQAEINLIKKKEATEQTIQGVNEAATSHHNASALKAQADAFNSYNQGKMTKMHLDYYRNNSGVDPKTGKKTKPSAYEIEKGLQYSGSLLNSGKSTMKLLLP